MKRTAAVIHIIIVVLIIGYGTYHLYQGKFDRTMATLPMLVVYYLFVAARQKRQHQSRHDKHDDL